MSRGISSRLIGVLNVEQTNLKTRLRECNDRLAAVPQHAPNLESVVSVFDLSERTRAKLERFFLNAVAFEGNDLKILGWSGPGEAQTLHGPGDPPARAKRELPEGREQPLP